MFKITFLKYNEKKDETELKNKILKTDSEEEAIEEAIKISIKNRKAILDTPTKTIVFRDGNIYKTKEKIEAPIGGWNFEVEAEVIENGKRYQYRKYIGSPEIKKLGGCYAVWCEDGRIKFCRNWMIRDRVYIKMLKEDI